MMEICIYILHFVLYVYACMWYKDCLKKNLIERKTYLNQPETTQTRDSLRSDQESKRYSFVSSNNFLN